MAAAEAPSPAASLADLSSLRDFFAESLRDFTIDPRQQFSVVYSQAAPVQPAARTGTTTTSTAPPAAATATAAGAGAAAAAEAGAGEAGQAATISKSVLILDSSFNPPTKAHEWIAKSALLEQVQAAGKKREQGEQEQERQGDGEGDREHQSEGASITTTTTTTRLLLLLATRNADKPVPPNQAGGFVDRMVMMVCLARDLLAEVVAVVADDDFGRSGRVVIDIGLTKRPYFVGKAEAIDRSGVYGYGNGVEQVHLVGFDTLTRIFERKYYAELGLEVLAPFLNRHRLRVLTRPDDKDDADDRKGWGSGKEQMEWLGKMASGELEDLGCRREWAQRIDLVDEEGAEVLGVSSTRARAAVKAGRWGDVDKFLGPTVAAWVRQSGLYQDDT